MQVEKNMLTLAHIRKDAVEWPELGEILFFQAPVGLTYIYIWLKEWSRTCIALVMNIIADEIKRALYAELILTI